METQSKHQLREQAVALRRAGLSRRQICSQLGVSDNRLGELVRGVPPSAWTRRPRAKDDLKVRARELRAEGTTVKAIAAALDVSKSSVSLWVRDMPGHEELTKRRPGPTRSASLRQHAALRRQRTKAAAAHSFGTVSPRDLFVAGVALYRAEGSKDKPYSRRERVTFINSDESVIRLFLTWLQLLGVPLDDLILRVQIHESADVAAAEQYWADVVGLPRDALRRSTLKRHNPKTVRHKTGATYHGCLTITVRKSSEFYRQIEGWWSALAERVHQLAGDPAGYAGVRLSPVGLLAGPARL